MNNIAIGLISIVALEHLYFLVLEMFLWTKPQGLKAFGLTKEFSEQSKVLAANQGLYNGFLSAGLLWSIFETNKYASLLFAIFFLGCVIVAGIYGAYSTKKIKLLLFQSLPAFIALFYILLTK